MAFLFLKLEGRDERSRVGTLLCLRHLINSSTEHLTNKKELIVTGVKPLLEETNLKVLMLFVLLLRKGPQSRLAFMWRLVVGRGLEWEVGSFTPFHKHKQE